MCGSTVIVSCERHSLAGDVTVAISRSEMCQKVKNRTVSK